MCLISRLCFSETVLYYIHASFNGKFSPCKKSHKRFFFPPHSFMIVPLKCKKCGESATVGSLDIRASNSTLRINSPQAYIGFGDD